MHLGGHNGRKEFVAAGEAISQAARAEPCAKSGETCCTAEAWALLRPMCTGSQVSPQAAEGDDAHGLWYLRAVCPPPERALVLQHGRVRPDGHSALLPLLRRYVPDTVALHLHDEMANREEMERQMREDAEENGDSGGSPNQSRRFSSTSTSELAKASTRNLSEIREVTCVFINLKGLQLASSDPEGAARALEAGHAAMHCVQEEVHFMEGEVNKMLVDDKGTILLVIFGLPPRPHVDDPLRAVRTAMLLAEIMCGNMPSEEAAQRLSEASFRALQDEPKPMACLGVATGRVFCGTVGTAARREFTTMGDAVNLAARLMQQASQPNAAHRVLVDEVTTLCTRLSISFKPLPPARLKGKGGTVALFAPLAELVEAPENAQPTISLMGRDVEYRQLRRMISDLLVYNDGGGVIMLVGSRGSGRRVLVKGLAEFGAAAKMVVVRHDLGEQAEQLRKKHGDTSLRMQAGTSSRDVLRRRPESIGRDTRRSINGSANDLHTLAVSGRSDGVTNPSTKSESDTVDYDDHSLGISESNTEKRSSDDAEKRSSDSGAGRPASLSILTPARIPSTPELTRTGSMRSVGTGGGRNDLDGVDVLGDLCRRLLEHGPVVLKVSTLDFVREALLAEQQMETPIELTVVEHPDEPAMVSVVRAARIGEFRRELLQYAWVLLDALGPEGQFVGSDQLPRRSVKSLGSPLGAETICELLMLLTLALLRHLARHTPRLMLLSYLDSGTSLSSQVPIWTWRIVSLISRECSAGRLPLVLCVVSQMVHAPHYSPRAADDPGTPVGRDRSNTAGSSRGASVKSGRERTNTPHAPHMSPTTRHGVRSGVTFSAGSSVAEHGPFTPAAEAPPPALGKLAEDKPVSSASLLVRDAPEAEGKDPAAKTHAWPSAAPPVLRMSDATSQLSVSRSRGPSLSSASLSVSLSKQETEDHERHRIFSELKMSSDATFSYLQLLPLTAIAWQGFFVQVLRSKYNYSGTLDGVPSTLLDFVASRTAGTGKPAFIEEMLEAVHTAGLLQFELDDVGDIDAGGMILTFISKEQLEAVPVPRSIKASMLQHFDSLDASLQATLKLASPCLRFSEMMMSDVGLPKPVVKRLAQLLQLAVDEGILVQEPVAPEEVLLADPTATRAWAWRMEPMRLELLEAMLHTDRERVEKKMQELRRFHESRREQARERSTVRVSSYTRPQERGRMESGESRGGLSSTGLAMPMPLASMTPAPGYGGEVSVNVSTFQLHRRVRLVDAATQCDLADHDGKRGSMMAATLRRLGSSVEHGSRTSIASIGKHKARSSLGSSQEQRIGPGSPAAAETAEPPPRRAERGSSCESASHGANASPSYSNAAAGPPVAATESPSQDRKWTRRPL